ncbi:unnamed protein product, partial [Prorocentrum cordatum]
ASAAAADAAPPAENDAAPQERARPSSPGARGGAVRGGAARGGRRRGSGGRGGRDRAPGRQADAPGRQRGRVPGPRCRPDQDGGEEFCQGARAGRDGR